MLAGERFTEAGPLTSGVSLNASQPAVVLALLGLVAVVWYVADRGRFRRAVADRLLYGLPVGTILTALVLIALYLGLQGGLDHWEDPLVLPFVSWSYFYPLGTLAAGLTHSSPGHLISNLAGTLAFGAVAEYAWSHYPPGDDREPQGLKPWFRAIVVYPVALLGAALVTSAVALGPGIGFSGAVYAIVGLALVWYPRATVLGAVAASGLGTVVQALREPVVRAGITAGPPAPPAWAGVGFHAHAMGFLIGVLVGGGLLWYRGRRPSPRALAFGTLAIGLVQGLWLVVWTDGPETYVMYRGLGVVALAGATLLVTAAVTASDRPVPRLLPQRTWLPSRRQLAIGWLGLVGLGATASAAGTLLSDTAPPAAAGLSLVVAAVLGGPALPVVLTRGRFSGPLSRRAVAMGLLAFLTVVLALPGMLSGLAVVADAPGNATSGDDPDSITVRDYTVDYAANASSPQQLAIDLGAEPTATTNYTGVIVESPPREIWTIGMRERQLDYSGNGTVVVGGVGWRESITVNRSGWDVLGTDTAYAVDLSVDETTTRSFVSGPVESPARIAGHRLAVAPTPTAMEVRLTGGNVTANAVIPSINESVTIGGITVTTRQTTDRTQLVAQTETTSVVVAERERYPGS